MKDKYEERLTEDFIRVGRFFIEGFDLVALPGLEKEFALYGSDEDLSLPDMHRRDKIISILFHFDKVRESFSVLDKLCGV